MHEIWFEAAPAALLAVDGDERVLAANAAARALLGRELLPGSTLSGRVGDEVAILVRRLARQQVGRGGVDTELLDAAGVLRAVRIEGQASARGVLLALEPREAATEPAGAWPTTLVAAAARELRTPLVGALGSLELLAQSLPGEGQQCEARGVLELGRNALTRLDALADLASFESGAITLERAPLNPVALIEGAIGAVAALAHRRGLCATTILDPALPHNLRGDPAWFLRLIALLLENAGQHTRSGGIVLRARLLRREDDRCRVAVEVQDTGDGIAEALRPHPFEPLTARGDLGWHRERGLGLSLALCRHIARAMGGDVHYRPAAPRGSVFGFEADLLLDGDVPLTLEPRIAAVRDRRVLLVDPHPLRGASFIEQRRRWGMDARVVLDGRDIGRAFTGGWRPHLVLVNQTAPHAFEFLSLLADARLVGVVPLGTPPARERVPAGIAIEWLSAPLHREALLACFAGAPVPPIDAPDSTSAGAARAPRVLVAEDSESNRAVLLAQLRRLGLEADGVCGGADAIRLALQRRYGLVLLDLALPDLNGTEVARQIRAAAEGSPRVPIIAVTATGEPEDRDRALAAGMNALLTKPVPLTELAAAIERWTGHRPGTRALQEVPPAALSAAALAQLERDVGAEAYADLLARFARELDERSARIESAVQVADAATLGREAHALKSAARAFGAGPVAELAAAIENCLREGRGDRAMLIAGSVGEAVRDARREVGAALARAGAVPA